MEIKAELLKPCTEDEKLNFIVSQNHNQGYEIRETKESLQAWGYTEEEIEEQEQERIGELELTSSDVERAIYEAKGMDFTDLVKFVIAQEIEGFDVKRLKIELKANHFVRKHPYINMIGEMLGYTPDDMNYLFENKKFPEKIEEEVENDNTTDNTTDTDIVQDEVIDE